MRDIVDNRSHTCLITIRLSDTVVLGKYSANIMVSVIKENIFSSKSKISSNKDDSFSKVGKILNYTGNNWMGIF